MSNLNQLIEVADTLCSSLDSCIEEAADTLCSSLDNCIEAERFCSTKLLIELDKLNQSNIQISLSLQEIKCYVGGLV